MHHGSKAEIALLEDLAHLISDDKSMLSLISEKVNFSIF